MKKERDDSSWREKLNPEEFHILREKGTERPFSGKFVKFDKKGEFICAGCGNALFDSKLKFDSGCGWPSFYNAKKGSVKFKMDLSNSMIRKEVLCMKCGGHLGHVFKDAPQTPTGNRFCINSVALKFKGK